MGEDPSFFQRAEFELYNESRAKGNVRHDATIMLMKMKNFKSIESATLTKHVKGIRGLGCS
jgi:hypothetical protein